MLWLTRRVNERVFIGDVVDVRVDYIHKDGALIEFEYGWKESVFKKLTYGSQINIKDIIRIDDDIFLTVYQTKYLEDISKTQISLRIKAPSDMYIHREEVYRRIQKEKEFNTRAKRVSL